MTLEFRQIVANGLRFHVAMAGPADGPLVVLLHGFPEFWYGWRNQLSALAEAGFRVWAPDQRGYNLSDKPRGAAAYAIGHLAADVAALIETAGRERAIVVGHDWGGAVAWHLAEYFPERVERAVVVNVPHPAVMLHQLRRNPKQLWRSWYMFFFQLPWLPERLLKLRQGALLGRSLRRTSRPGTFSESDLKRYREAWLQPGAMHGMLNWYRAAMRHSPPALAAASIRTPILLIWGARDHFLGRETAQPSIDLCTNGQLVFLDDATHWAPHEEPARVNQLLLEFATRTK